MNVKGGKLLFINRQMTDEKGENVCYVPNYTI